MKTQSVNPMLEQRLKNLPADADKALAGLTAGPHLKLQIEKAAANPQPRSTRPAMTHWIPAVSLALVLAVGAVIGIPMLSQPPQTNQLITAHSLGDAAQGGERALLDLGNNNVSISNEANVPSYRSIWAKGSNGNFPLIGVNGQYYRMMTTPSSVRSGLLGSSLGTVAEFNLEPSLSGASGILSNEAALGTTVYEISGMGGAFVAAEVNGKVRLFQRVGFNGNAIKGGETLADTLRASGRITAMELSNVGIITDSSLCNQLYQVLVSNASYKSSGTVSGRQSLLIELDNGLTLQLAVKNDTLAACGTWSCPEFFEAFENALK